MKFRPAITDHLFANYTFTSFTENNAKGSRQKKLIFFCGDKNAIISRLKQ